MLATDAICSAKKVFIQFHFDKRNICDEQNLKKQKLYWLCNIKCSLLPILLSPFIKYLKNQQEIELFNVNRQVNFLPQKLTTGIYSICEKTSSISALP